MKKILFLLLLTSAAVAQDKEKCKKDSASCKPACCKQPSKTANLRMKAVKPAPTTAAKPAIKK